MNDIFKNIKLAREEMANTSYGPTMIDPTSGRFWRSKYVHGKFIENVYI